MSVVAQLTVLPRSRRRRRTATYDEVARLRALALEALERNGDAWSASLWMERQLKYEPSLRRVPATLCFAERL